MDTDNDNDSGETGVGGRTFTQADVEKMIAKKTRQIKQLEEQLAAAPKQDQLEELQQQLADLKSDQELAGKTQIERLTHKYERELEKMGAKFAQLEAEAKAKDAQVAEAYNVLKNERTSRAFNAALMASDVFPKSATDALTVLMQQVRDVEVGEDGSVRATYGDDLIDESPEAIAKRFLSERPYFAAAKGGGSGQRAPNGTHQQGSRPLHEMTMDELAEAAGAAPSTRS